jgi:hypothetical protein
MCTTAPTSHTLPQPPFQARPPTGQAESFHRTYGLWPQARVGKFTARPTCRPTAVGDSPTGLPSWLTQYEPWLTHYEPWLTHYEPWLQAILGKQQLVSPAGLPPWPTRPQAYPPGGFTHRPTLLDDSPTGLPS